MFNLTTKDIEIKEANCLGQCCFCKIQNIFYSILNGNFVYYCHKCKKWINKDNIEIIRKVIK